MTDKVQKIREEVQRLHNLLPVMDGDNISVNYADRICTTLEMYIDSLQEEPAKDRFVFKAIPRLLDMIEPTDRAKSYVTKLADAFDSEGYYTDAKIVRESLKIMNGEKVPMATMDDEHVSEELEEVAFDYAESCKYDGGEKLLCVEHFKAGAKWGKNQAMVEIQAQSMALAHGCPKENTSNDLKEAADNALESITDQYDIISVGSCLEMFMLGAKWQKTQEYACYEEAFEDGAKWKVENLWKPADGDDLPEIDREVIVLTQPYPLENLEYAVSFAHRPNPNGWDGKSVTTGKVEHYTPKTYDKGGWNIPDVKYWLDYDINELLCREK